MIHRYSAGNTNNVADIEIYGDIAADTLLGLSTMPKFLLPKYFYDDKGSAIFGEIMNMPEYYLTKCENEILSEFSTEIVNSIIEDAHFVNLIEPGSGDGSKTLILLKAFSRAGKKFRFIPVDISREAHGILENTVLTALPGTDVRPITGDYFHMFEQLGRGENERNAVLFLGSNIGNLNNSELNRFLDNISEFAHRGDKLLIGFDLKKSPGVILKAYDDPYGLTRKFNINHLLRLNRELQADFNPSLFEHHTEYNPVSGELKSFLVSSEMHQVHIGAIGETFLFRQWEPVFMELSRKFDIATIETLAISHGFRVVNNFTDSKNWFIDSLWTRI
jgi:L-histidine Nalpha-methyltransferase